MPAIGESAGAVPVGEFGEAKRNPGDRHMGEAEFFQTWCVDQAGLGVESVQTRCGGRVATTVKKGGDGGRERVGIRDQRVYQGRLAHARLAHEYRVLAGKQRSQRRNVGQRREADQSIAGTHQGVESLADKLCAGEVGLVEHDDRLHALMLGGNRRAGDQFVGKARFRSDGDCQLGRVGREQLRAVLDRTREE